LEEEGYTVDTAKNGKEAIHKSKIRFYNLALIDIRLPDIKGVELLKTMKETTPRMRKIVVTGYPSLQNAVEALNKGANAYIMKPFAVTQILELIKEQLRKQQEEKEYNEKKVTEFIETRVRELDKKETLTARKSQ
jgi:DNA-binding NtrC family response regulator